MISTADVDFIPTKYGFSLKHSMFRYALLLNLEMTNLQEMSKNKDIIYFLFNLVME
jgi:hypothetical protein